MATAKWIAMAALSLAASAHAGEDADLSTRSRTLAKSIEASSGAPAPFMSRAEVLGSLSMREAAVERAIPCADMRAVCYDAKDRGLVYRGAREYMPRAQGLTPEGVALRRDRLILRYSFR